MGQESALLAGSSASLRRMARSLALGIALFALAGCTGSVNPTGDGGIGDAGPTPVEPLDSGSSKNPPIATTFGPFTGAFDINGAGELFAIQVDDHLGIELNDLQHLYIGAIDGGAFDAGLIYPDLASCGVGALGGRFDPDSGYAATEQFCAGGQQVSAQIFGNRFTGSNTYRQELAWSGAYDLTEKPSSSNGCSGITGPHPLTVGVARDLDGGAVTALLAGDGLLDELAFGAVDVNTGILSARAKDSAGNDTSQLTLYFLVDGGVGGARTFIEPVNGCNAAFDLAGSKR